MGNAAVRLVEVLAAVGGTALVGRWAYGAVDEKADVAGRVLAAVLILVALWLAFVAIVLYVG
jgi:hypothetical protein